jgi:hypothetical protein
MNKDKELQEILNKIKSLKYTKPTLDSIIPKLEENIDKIKPHYRVIIQSVIFKYRKGYKLSNKQKSALWASYHDL